MRGCLLLTMSKPLNYIFLWTLLYNLSIIIIDVSYCQEINDQDKNCGNFSDYAAKCIEQSSKIYKSTRKTPPLPKDMQNWCRNVKFLTKCAQDWNLQCRDLTDTQFNEESINGRTFVINNICNNDEFLGKYQNVTECVAVTAERWEECYKVFRYVIDNYKNKSSAIVWTHYDTHFHLCCERARFRGCVLDIVFSSVACNPQDAVTVQQFSVIISEGDVYQDCDANTIYANCPGGDPRPKSLRSLNQSELVMDTQSNTAGQSNITDVASSIEPPMYAAVLWVVFVILK